MTGRAFTVCLIGLVGLFAGNSAVGAADHTDARSSSATPASRMERTPAYVLAYCRKSHRLPLACPHLLPRMEQPSPHWDANLCLVGNAGCQGLTWDDLSLVDAGQGNDPRPPLWSHVSIYAGNLGSAFRFAYPTRGIRPRQLDGLFARTRTHAIFLGSYTWGGKRGIVVLAPDFPNGGEQGDHVIFGWRASGIECAVGLHGWEPFEQAFATLRSMVRSI
jgi:hypothetical protein